MNKPTLDQILIEKIQGASSSVSDTKLGEELRIHRNTVRKYRRQARQERQEAAREIISRHVEANIPDALEDLTKLRQLAQAAYEAKGDSRDGSLWLAAIKTTLEHVRPDDSALDAAIEAELAGVDAEGQGAAAGKGSGTTGVQFGVWKH